MEKWLITFMLMLIGINTSIAQYDAKNAERERIASAKVKTQMEFTHDYKDGKPAEQGYKSAVRKYDTKGNITEETNYNAAGKIISVILYQYDNKGNQVNYERYQGNREKLQYSQKIVYDAKSNKTKEYGYDGATVYSNTYTYNSAGKLSEIVYTSNNNTVETRKLSYSGNKMDIQIFTAGKTLSFTQVNMYNAKGNVVSEIKTDNAGKIVYSLTYEYKNDVILLSETKKRGDIVEYQKTYQYDGESRPVKEETSNMGGAKFISHEYRYNTISFLEEEKWKKNQHSKEVSSKKIGYAANGIYSEVESYFATYKLYSLYKYSYEFY